MNCVSEQNKEKASFLYALKGVLWAMIGVRRGGGYDEDVKKINPKQAIFVGIIMVIVFILTIYTVVSIVIGQATS
jgi:amino acid transporter